MFKKIFEKVTKKRILKEISKLRPQGKKTFKYISNSQSIGVIINITSEQLNKNTDEFIKLLQKENEVNFVKFVNHKPKKKETLPENTFTIYGKKYLYSERLSDFLHKNFDILIVISMEENIKLHHIVAMAKADLKVSPHFNEFNFADLTFIIKNKIDCSDYLEAVKQYLLKNN
ncbi:MAG: hypothetical protein JXR68_12355 [Bacteroidales bacterium]|nr:hypothetical protein [Bacteroidales bacterium]